MLARLARDFSRDIHLLDELRDTSLTRFSPLDLLVVLRLLAFVVVWKLWSTDFGALEVLRDATPTVTLEPDWLDRAVDRIQDSWMTSQSRIRLFQIVAGAALLAGALFRNRALFGAGIVLVTVFTAIAFRFSSTFYEYDFAIPLFVLYFLFFDWSADNGFWGERNPTRWSNNLGTAIGVYIGLAYFLAGWSKLVFNRWWPWDVDLENLPEAMLTWHGAEPSGLLSGPSSLLESVLELPVVGTVAPLTVLVAELFWITCFASKRARQIFPPIIAFSHVVIFLGSGIFFKAWPLAALALLAPWAQIVGRFASDSAPIGGGQVQLRRARLLAPFAIVVLAIMVPVSVGRATFPLARYDSFGWSYSQADEPRSFYAFAVESADGEAVIIDHNYFGFFDFVATSRASTLIGLSLPDGDVESWRHLDAICDVAISARDHRSNEWMLGPLALPAHVMYLTPQVTRFELQDVQVVELHWSEPAINREPEVTTIARLDAC